MAQTLFFLALIAAAVGAFCLKAWLISQDFRKALRYLRNSTPLIHSLMEYAQKLGIKEFDALKNFYAESWLFPKHQLHHWRSDIVFKKITVPVTEIISLLGNKHFAIFESLLSHEIGHQIVGLERPLLQQECKISGPCLSDEIRAWRQALEIIRELCGGIENWNPQVAGKTVSFEEIYNFIENALNIECSECQKMVKSRKCPRTNDVQASRMHIKRILDAKI